MIDLKSKILNITHGDLDGCVASILLSHVFKNITIADKQFYDIDEYLKNLDYSNYDYVILTDIHPEHNNLLNISHNIILLDHHESSIACHNPSKYHFINTKMCGAALTKLFIEKVLKVNLNGQFDELVLFTNDYDMWIKKYPQSDKLNYIYNKYFSNRFRTEFANGRTEFTASEEKYVNDILARRQKEIDELEVFDLDLIKGCVIKTIDFVNDLADYLLKQQDYKIVFVYNPRRNTLSIRCKDIGDFHAGNLLKKFNWGGGHKCAAGMGKMAGPELRTKISCIEQEIYDYFPDFRLKA